MKIFKASTSESCPSASAWKCLSVHERSGCQETEYILCGRDFLDHESRGVPKISDMRSVLDFQFRVLFLKTNVVNISCLENAMFHCCQHSISTATRICGASLRFDWRGGQSFCSMIGQKHKLGFTFLRSLLGILKLDNSCRLWVLRIQTIVKLHLESAN